MVGDALVFPRAIRALAEAYGPDPDRFRQAIPANAAQGVFALADLEPGERGAVSRVPDGDPDLLRYLAELGLVPGSDVEVVARAPFAGPVTVRTGSGSHAISVELADRIGAAAA